MLEIDINNIYNSSDLLFSIPVHEKQDIINNQIENILNYNLNSNIILHINKSFKNFNENLTKYDNVYINSKNFNYIYSKGLLWIHINNFLEAMRINVNFKYFVMISSNEMFIRNGLNLYIEKYKNGLQIEEFNIDKDWHNFNKKIEEDPKMLFMLEELNLTKIYGGQAEGQFYEKKVFNKIVEIYLKFYGTNELNNFETEEILCQTIFKSLNISYTYPFTLQNYSNNLEYNEDFIELIRNNKIIIKNDKKKNGLISPHVNLDCSSIYSIKRVDRSFNDIRNYLSNKGFMLNKKYQLNTYYYSNNSKIILLDENHIKFEKNSNIKMDFNWIGYELDEGFYYICFNIKINTFLKNYDKIGLKLHYPYEIIYNFFFNDITINEWKNVKIPIYIIKKQYIIFIFDEYFEHLIIEFKDIQIININKNSEKKNIILFLYEIINDNNDYSINYTNIKNTILDEFKDYNVYTFISLYNLNINKINKIINCYKPYILTFFDGNINNLFIENINNINYFSKKTNIEFEIFLSFRLDSIFNKKITEFNFKFDKFNFISYHIPYIDNKISNSYNFLSIPYKYINYFYDLLYENIDNSNICYLIYDYLIIYLDKSNFNFIYNDNYTNNMRNPLIKYLSDIENLPNNGFDLNKNYLNNIYYNNIYSKILKNENEFYYHKSITFKKEPFQWIGILLKDIEELNIGNKIIISFNIKFIKKININNLNNNFGLKIHYPQKYINYWIDSCELNKYESIKIESIIDKKSQYIILNFDEYFGEIEFYIKDYKIILDYII